jgi:hypothetical protein
MSGEGIALANAHDCALHPETYWALRDDPAFEQFTANYDSNVHEVLSLDKDPDTGQWTVGRASAKSRRHRILYTSLI